MRDKQGDQYFKIFQNHLKAKFKKFVTYSSKYVMFMRLHVFISWSKAQYSWFWCVAGGLNEALSREWISWFSSLKTMISNN